MMTLIEAGKVGKSKRELPEALTAEQVEEFRKRIVTSTITDDEISQELALALALAERIRSGNFQVDSAYERLKYVFDCLLATRPKLVEARGERIELQIDVYSHIGFVTSRLARWSRGSPTGVVLAALVASLTLWAFVALAIQVLIRIKIFGSTLSSDVFFMNGRALAVISSAAFIGGVISIATRLRDFSRVSDLDPLMMFWTALLKPLIGVVLSWFVLAALAGDVVSFGFLGTDPLSLGEEAEEVPDKTLYVLWVLGFLSGFSERFALDFIDRAQGGVSTVAPNASGTNRAASTNRATFVKTTKEQTAGRED